MGGLRDRRAVVLNLVLIGASLLMLYPWLLALSTAIKSLPSTCRQSRPPAMPFCASVSAPVWAERGTEIAQPLLITHSTSGSL